MPCFSSSSTRAAALFLLQFFGEGQHFVALRLALEYLRQQRMLGREDDRIRAEDRVYASCEDRDRFVDPSILKRDFAPRLRPIQLRCIAMTRSGHPPSSSSRPSSN